MPIWGKFVVIIHVTLMKKDGDRWYDTICRDFSLAVIDGLWWGYTSEISSLSDTNHLNRSVKVKSLRFN
ncbi:MAG: hypothetical protein F6K16_40710 [Symploca sp. SIO2B6]|nr:hypothetical protein [Symploca sp. SIO2B6]